MGKKKKTLVWRNWRDSDILPLANNLVFLGGCLHNCLLNPLSWTSWTSRFSYTLSVFLFTFPFLYDGLLLWCMCFVLFFKEIHLYVDFHCLSSITIMFSKLFLTLCFFCIWYGFLFFFSGRLSLTFPSYFSAVSVLSLWFLICLVAASWYYSDP